MRLLIAMALGLATTGAQAVCDRSSATRRRLRAVEAGDVKYVVFTVQRLGRRQEWCSDARGALVASIGGLRAQQEDLFALHNHHCGHATLDTTRRSSPDTIR